MRAMSEFIMRKLGWSAALVLALGLMSEPGSSIAAAADTAANSYEYLVFTDPVEGKEAEYNRWYQQTHAPEVASNAGVISAQRYVATDLDPRSKPIRKYLTLYKIDSSDLAATFKGFKQTSAPAQGELIAPNSSVTWVYRPLGPEIKGWGKKSFGKGAMKTYVMFIRNGPYAGKDAEYNRWYNSTHVHDVSGTPGVVSGQRYIFNDVQRNANVAPPPTQYLVKYTIVTDDLTAVFAGLDARAPKFVISPAYDPSTSLHFSYEALGAEVKKVR